MDSASNPKNYRIGEFAKRMGVSPHFLKYYEESGILRPDTHENRYRFYNMWDASIILECKRMKNMGFSVKESHKIITDSTAADLEQMLQTHADTLSAEVGRKQMALEALQKMRADLRLCQTMEWQICPSRPVWFLPHTEEQAFISDAGTYSQLESWVDAMPVVRSAQRLTWDDDGQWHLEWGFTVPADKVDALGLKPAAPAVLMSTDRVFEQYITYPIHPETAQEEHNQQYRRAIAHVRRLNLVPGPTLLKEVISYTLQGGIRQVYCILRVQVKEASPAAADTLHP